MVEQELRTMSRFLGGAMFIEIERTGRKQVSLQIFLEGD